MRAVNVSTQDQAVSYITKTGDEKVFGSVAIDTFEGEGVRSISFRPTADNTWANKSKKDSGYRLGLGSGELSIANPADVQRIFLNAGLEMVDQYAGSGGLDIVSTFISPKTEFEDPINYDKDLWGDRGSLDKMWWAVRVSTSLEIGRMAATIQQGAYRLICTNGMVGQVFGLADIKVRHIGWDQTKEEMILSRLNIREGMPQGQLIGNKKTLMSITDILRRYREQSESPTGLTPQYKVLQNEFRHISLDVITPAHFDLFVDHLGAIQRKAEDEVYTLDLVNAYTSSINRRRMGTEVRGALSAFSNTDNVVDTISRLGHFAALFSNN